MRKILNGFTFAPDPAIGDCSAEYESSSSFCWLLFFLWRGGGAGTVLIFFANGWISKRSHTYAGSNSAAKLYFWWALRSIYGNFVFLHKIYQKKKKLKNCRWYFFKLKQSSVKLVEFLSSLLLVTHFENNGAPSYYCYYDTK